MTRCVKECDGAAVYLYAVSTDVLCDTACLTRCNVCAADAVKKGCLTVVNVTHNNDNGCTVDELCICIFVVVDKSLFDCYDNFFRRGAFFFWKYSPFK